MSSKTRKEEKPYLKPDASGESVRITLSRPVQINGVRQNTLYMRTPTIGDVRAAQKQGRGDKEEEEILLFASLMDCGIDDIPKLSVRDYKRVNDAYFRLTDEPETESDAGRTAIDLPEAGA
jgi:hypothetical protein